MKAVAAIENPNRVCMASEPSQTVDSVVRMIADSHKGSKAALERLMARYRPYLRQLAACKVGKRGLQNGDASEIAQDTAYQVVKSLDGFRGQSREEFHGWLRTVFRRAYSRWALSVSRQRVHAIACAPESSLVDSAADSQSLEERVMAAERDLRIMAITTELPAELRLILWIRLYCKMPFAEIAGVLGINKKTAETRYYRAVKRLRRQLEKSKDEP